MKPVLDCCHHCGELLDNEVGPLLCLDHHIGHEDSEKVADDPDEVPSISYDVLDMVEQSMMGDINVH